MTLKNCIKLVLYNDNARDHFVHVFLTYACVHLAYGVLVYFIST